MFKTTLKKKLKNLQKHSVDVSKRVLQKNQNQNNTTFSYVDMIYLLNRTL